MLGNIFAEPNAQLRSAITARFTETVEEHNRRIPLARLVGVRDEDRVLSQILTGILFAENEARRCRRHFVDAGRRIVVDAAADCNTDHAADERDDPRADRACPHDQCSAADAFSLTVLLSNALTMRSCNCLAVEFKPSGMPFMRIENTYHWPSLACR